MAPWNGPNNGAAPYRSSKWGPSCVDCECGAAAVATLRSSQTADRAEGANPICAHGDTNIHKIDHRGHGMAYGGRVRRGGYALDSMCPHIWRVETRLSDTVARAVIRDYDRPCRRRRLLPVL